MALLFLLEVLISISEPFLHKITQNMSFCYDGEISAVQRKAVTWRFCVIACPWTSLARVLIKSLLAIPSSSLVRVFPCHPAPSLAHSFCFSLPRHGLWTSLSLQSHIKAQIEASSLLLSRWTENWLCTCEWIRLRWLKQRGTLCPLLIISPLRVIVMQVFITLVVRWLHQYHHDVTTAPLLTGLPHFSFTLVLLCTSFLVIGWKHSNSFLR